MKAGLYVPIYSDLANETNAIAAAKAAYPDLPILVCINPASGPGTAPRSDIQAAMIRLRALGVQVIGYVDTAYAKDPIASVEAQVSAYRSWYAADGILFDDMSALIADAAYYRTLRDYCHQRGMALAVGNPGNAIPEDIVNCLDSFFVYEGAGFPPESAFEAMTFKGDYPKAKFALVVYGIAVLDPAWVAEMKESAQWLYVTNGILPNPYLGLPPYFNDLARAINQ